MFAHLLAIYQLIDHFLHPIFQNFTILFSIKDVFKNDLHPGKCILYEFVFLYISGPCEE